MKLRIMNEPGHTDLEVTNTELIEQKTDHPTHWVFIDGELMARESIQEIDWNAVQSVDLTPAIVGGQ